MLKERVVEFCVKETRDWNVMARVESAIPEFEQSHSAEDFRERLEGRPFLALLACDKETIVGYKIGYAETRERFYSWVGGVHPDYRGQGLAREMMRYQEDWCRAHGYHSIGVKSENRFQPMLIFLLREGYDIETLSARGQIGFRKML